MSAGLGCSTGIPARCDIESIEYSYSFSDEIQQEWVWTKTMPAQPEVEAYLNFVTDRLDLRRDISFNTEVVAMIFDEDAGEWLVETWAGESFVAPFVVAASGILSVPLEPQIPGMDSFAGPSLYTGCWPKDTVDFTGKHVGVIGTGSTGVQLIPVVAQQAGHLSVFQLACLHTAVAGAPVRTGRARRDEVPVRRDPRRTSSPGVCRRRRSGSFPGSVRKAAADCSGDLLGITDRQVDPCLALGLWHAHRRAADGDRAQDVACGIEYGCGKPGCRVLALARADRIAVSLRLSDEPAQLIRTGDGSVGHRFERAGEYLLRQIRIPCEQDS
jgi:hypothetical protein